MSWRTSLKSEKRTVSWNIQILYDAIKPRQHCLIRWLLDWCCNSVRLVLVSFFQPLNGAGVLRLMASSRAHFAVIGDGLWVAKLLSHVRRPAVLQPRLRKAIKSSKIALPINWFNSLVVGYSWQALTIHTLSRSRIESAHVQWAEKYTQYRSRTFLCFRNVRNTIFCRTAVVQRPIATISNLSDTSFLPNWCLFTKYHPVALIWRV